ncbi:hypothetical protein [Nocardia farcinica]|uniref:hypothetical protein n=1 Tax=Nocardia farcinica TaxID=37329 RepID=UPI002454A178|nr:hypothetical protein [Nocardia farcinica]
MNRGIFWVSVGFFRRERKRFGLFRGPGKFFERNSRAAVCVRANEQLSQCKEHPDSSKGTIMLDEILALIVVLVESLSAS